jgi:hypothetical protein
LLLTVALGLAGATPLMAQVDLYVTGSTAYRQSVYAACTKLFTTPPVLGSTLFFADAAHGGDANDNASTGSWAMTGTPVSTLTNISGGSLTIHGLFTGSIQGIETVENQVPLVFCSTNTGVYQTNTPTIGFSDASGVSSPYPATGDYSEAAVCVQPFVMMRANAANGVTNINNVSWEQLKYGIKNGYIPLSSWTGNTNDLTNLVYLIERTADSGTRRCETAQMDYQFGSTVTEYIYDFTNNFFFQGVNELNSLVGSYPNGVVGAAGLGNANLNWGSGYVSGGNIATELNYTNVNNLAIAFLSLNDSKSVGPTNWGTAVSFDGIWPTAAGIGLRGNLGTNNFAPITTGSYGLWGNEVVVYPNVDPTSLPGEQGQDLTANELGSQSQPGTILGVLLATNNPPIIGSIDNEILLSETNSPGATSIRFSDMYSSRQSVGGVITP